MSSGYARRCFHQRRYSGFFSKGQDTEHRPCDKKLKRLYCNEQSYFSCFLFISLRRFVRFQIFITLLTVAPSLQNRPFQARRPPDHNNKKGRNDQSKDLVHEELNNRLVLPCLVALGHKPTKMKLALERRDVKETPKQSHNPPLCPSRLSFKKTTMRTRKTKQIRTPYSYMRGYRSPFSMGEAVNRAQQGKE